MALAEALHQLVWPGHTRGVGAHDQQQRSAVRSAEILGPDHVAVAELHSMLHGPQDGRGPGGCCNGHSAGLARSLTAGVSERGEDGTVSEYSDVAPEVAERLRPHCLALPESHDERDWTVAPWASQPPT